MPTSERDFHGFLFDPSDNNFPLQALAQDRLLVTLRFFIFYLRFDFGGLLEDFPP